MEKSSNPEECDNCGCLRSTHPIQTCREFVKDGGKEKTKSEVEELADLLDGNLSAMQNAETIIKAGYIKRKAVSNE